MTEPKTPPAHAAKFLEKVKQHAVALGEAFVYHVAVPFSALCARTGVALADFFKPLVEKKPLLVLALLTVVYLLPGTESLPFVDRDESRFAHATEEMLNREAEGQPGAWVVPFFNGEYRFDKPPVVYWWMRAHYTLFGYNDFSARLHSVEATVLVAWLIFALGKMMFEARVGFWAAFAFLTCLQVVQHGRLCVADMPMMVFIMLAQLAAWKLWSKPSWAWAALLWVALAAGFSTKWVVPWAVTGLTMFTFAIIKKQWSPFKNFKPFSGAALMVVLILAWAIPAWIATKGDFFLVGIGEHVFTRGAAAFNARHWNPVFYLLTALVSLMPWIAVAGGFIPWIKTNWDDRTKFLVSWAGSLYIVFSLAQTQLPHYILPAFPAVLILLAAATDFRKPPGVWAQRCFFVFYGVWAALLLGGLLMVLAVPASDDALRVKLGGVLLLLSLGSLLGLGWARAYGKTLAVTALFILSPLAFWGTAVALRPMAVALQVDGALIKEKAPELFIAQGFEEPSLTAYTQHNWVYGGDYAAAKARYEAAPSAAMVVLAREFTLESLGQAILNKPLKAKRDNEGALLANPVKGGTRTRLSGINLGRFSWVDYDLFVKP